MEYNVSDRRASAEPFGQRERQLLVLRTVIEAHHDPWGHDTPSDVASHLAEECLDALCLLEREMNPIIVSEPSVAVIESAD